jgi:porin
VLLGVIAMLLGAALAPAHGAVGVFGDWGGLRTDLSDHGVDLEVSYINEFAANVAGGATNEAAYADQIYFGGWIDLGKLMDVRGSRIVFSFTDRNGESLSVKADLHTLLEVQEIYGLGNFSRLNQLYLEQWLFKDHLRLKFGRLTGTFDFMPFSCYFQNITFCATLPSHNVAANWIPFPGSTWAGVARWDIRSDWYAQAGVYEVNPDFYQPKYRFAFGAPFGGLGEREVLEVGWLPKSAGGDGGYRLGVWYDNVGGDDLYLNTDGMPLATQGGMPLRRHNQKGFYAMAQHRVWSPEGSTKRGISLFMNFVQADGRIAEIQQIAEVGFLWTGPTAWRPQDDFSGAVGRTHVNSLIADDAILYNSELLPPYGPGAKPVPYNEYTAEIHYSVNVTPAVLIRPNVQLIRAPGGVAERPTVLVLGAHLTIQF